MKKHRLLTIVLVTAMLLLPLGAATNAVADGIYSDGEFSYKIVNNVATVWEYHGRDANVVVPSTFNGMRVTAMGNGTFSECGFLESVVVSEGIEVLGPCIFQRCFSLRSVSLPSSLRIIKKNVFSFCESLEQLVIPTGVQEIEEYAFSGCYSLTDISLPSTLSSLGRGAFSHCSSLTTIKFPGSMNILEPDTLRKCTGLDKVYIPASIYKIDPGFASQAGKFIIVTHDNTAAYRWAEKYGYLTQLP